MHECPDCGQACDCDGEDIWNDAAARDCRHYCEEEWDDGDWEYDFGDVRRGPSRLDACVDCGSPSVSEMCQCCGGWLCFMHSETGAGFCRNCPTQEWIDEQQVEAL